MSAVDEIDLSKASSGFSVTSQTQPLSVQITPRNSSSSSGPNHQPDHGWGSKQRTATRRVLATVGVLLLCAVFSATLYVASDADFLGGSEVIISTLQPGDVIVCPAAAEDDPTKYPDGSNCHRYYVCVNRRAYYVTCGEGQVFDIDRRSCHKDALCNMTLCQFGPFGSTVGGQKFTTVGNASSDDISALEIHHNDFLTGVRVRHGSLWSGLYGGLGTHVRTVELETGESVVRVRVSWRTDSGKLDGLMVLTSKEAVDGVWLREAMTSSQDHVIDCRKLYGFHGYIDENVLYSLTFNCFC